MTRSTATLSNCYVPLVDSEFINESKTDLQDRLESSRSSGDGETSRGVHELRRLCMETGVTDAVGSSLVELGHTKVICEVEGPTPTAEEGTIKCSYAPLIAIRPENQVASMVQSLDAQCGINIGKLNSQTMYTEIEMSSRLYDAFCSAVRLDKIPKSVLTVNVTVLQDDGSALSAAVAACSLALSDANVELYDLVVSCTVACFATDNVADPNESEMLAANALVTLAVMPNFKEATLWDQKGKLSSQTSSQAIELARDGCRTIHRFMRQCLIDHNCS